jgi:hypothetical protein
MYGELKKIGKEVIVTDFKVLSRHLRVRTEEKHGRATV